MFSAPTLSPVARAVLCAVAVVALPLAGHLPLLAGVLFLGLASLLPCQTEGQTVRAVLLLAVAGIFAALSIGGTQSCSTEWALTAGSLYLMSLVILIARR
jgi:hypothetical protein